MKEFSINTPEQFQQLYGRYYKVMMLYALKMTDDQDAAEDLVQNVFLTLWENRETFHEEASVRSYLYLTIRRRVIDQARHAKVEGKYKSYVLKGAGDMLMAEEDDEIFTNEVYHRLFDAINELPPRQRELFLLYMQGKKNAEIAQAMNITEETIRVQKKRALKTLRKKMGDRSDLLLLWLLFC
ncbi:MAG TPA: RNA polymerase sigma-70 factor [Prevotella sp.]|nr:RNA polymerase sigma-70 factor [uncultured Prevotella sp.]HBF06268.1 RNA polymerase sigma-70 factor [Candidatus Segatella violae]